MRSRVVRVMLPIMKSPVLKYVAIAIVTVGLLYLAFRGQDLGASMDAMGRARWIPLVGGLIIMFLSHGVRALRWRIVLRPLKQHTSLWLAFKATIGGYAMNNLIPRSGELVRPYMMARGENIPIAGTLATVVVERLADVLALAALIVFSLVSFQSRVTNVFPMFNGEVLWGLAVMLLLLTSLILVFFSERRTEQMVTIVARPLPIKWRDKIIQMGRDFSHGIRGLEKSAILPIFVGTASICILYGISMYVSLQAFDDPAMSAPHTSRCFFIINAFRHRVHHPHTRRNGRVSFPYQDRTGFDLRSSRGYRCGVCYSDTYTKLYFHNARRTWFSIKGRNFL